MMDSSTNYLREVSGQGKWAERPGLTNVTDTTAVLYSIVPPLMQLPAKQRLMVLLRLEDRLSAEEISKHLSLPIALVRNQLAQAMRSLHKALCTNTQLDHEVAVSLLA